MNKEEQVKMRFRDLYNKMAWLNKLKMEDSFNGYKSSEVHCIEYIGRNVDPNVTKLAESFYMTRGAISKMSKKLIKKGVIESYQKPDNKRVTSTIKTTKTIIKCHLQFQPDCIL